MSKKKSFITLGPALGPTLIIPLYLLNQVMDIRIEHDNTGFSPNWFLDTVVIEVGCQGKTYTFEYKGWLNETNDNSVSFPPSKIEDTAKSKMNVPL